MYIEALKAMNSLLATVGEQYWQKEISKHIRQWESRRDASMHRGIYGGMGSFNDVIICSANGHRVSEEQEPWVNILFGWLKSLCYQLSSEPEQRPTACELAKGLGYHDSNLAAFVGGKRATEKQRKLSSAQGQIQGWRCLLCGYGQVSKLDIRYSVAEAMVPVLLFEAAEVGSLEKLVSEALGLRIQGVKEAEARSKEVIESANIKVVDAQRGFMRPCPHCGEEDTAVYRWSIKGAVVSPSDDNLPLKRKPKIATKSRKRWVLW